VTTIAPDLSDAPDNEMTAPPRPRRWGVEPLVAVVGFALFALIVLTRPSALLEPDDYAYRASIVALTHGHVLLSTVQYHALAHQVGTIAQWHHLASGLWISEKNPGYPFLAAPFALAHLLRLAPLAFGALGAVGLYHGARAWLGRGAGALAVWLFCFSGAALTFAWRSTMPSFTDASLVAAGAGGLLWTMLRADATPRRRLLVGLASFAAMEAAVAVRYTNVIELGVAVLAVLVLGRRCAVSWRTTAAWLASVVSLVVAVLGFDEWAYGHATSTGYSTGEISFSLSSLGANLRAMPAHLTRAMPLWLLAALALGAIALRLGRRAGVDDLERATRVRDGVVALVLGAGWLGLWFLYLTYTWTAGQLGGGPGGSSITVHVIRFYLPALGLLALLGAWTLRAAPRLVRTGTLAALVLASLVSFHTMASSGTGGPGVGPVGGPGAPSSHTGPAGAPPGGGPGQPPGLGAGSGTR
jgi:hypothetical protein